MNKKILLGLIVSCSILFAQKHIYSLDEAIQTALENKNSLKVSKTSVKIAQTLYKQAMSANYPKFDLNIMAMRIDEDPSYGMVGTTTVDNRLTKATAGHLASAALAAGDNENAAKYLKITQGPDYIQLPINMKVKVMDRDSVIGQINMEYPIYVGGKIDSITTQAKIGKKIAQEDIKRTKSQIIFDVKKYYYSVVLSKQLKQLSNETLERMKFLENLTSRLYQGGSMHVKRTDYLRSKLSVNFIESLDERLSEKEEMAKSAFVNAMGLPWQTIVDVKDDALKKPKMTESMNRLIKNAYKFNPDYTTLNLAIDIKKAKIDESKSDNYPHIGLNASAQRVYNDYDYGMVNDANTKSWTIGIGAKWSLFNGFRTRNEIEQSKLEKLKLEQTKILLEEGLALQVKQAFLAMKSSYVQYNILKKAFNTSEQNRELNVRAYQEDMVETKEVVEAQILESYTKADFYRCVYDHAIAKAKLDLIIGNVIQEMNK